MTAKTRQRKVSQAAELCDPTQIWVVSSGSYSDYSVLAAFTSKSLAEEAAKMQTVDSYRSYRVESLQSFGRPPTMITTFKITTTIWDNGESGHRCAGESDVHPYWKSERSEPEFDMMYQRAQRPDVRFVRAPVYKNKGGRLDVRCEDEQACWQAFSDNLVQIKTNIDVTGKATL